MNPQEKDSQRIKRDDKQYIEKLNYKGVIFPVSQKHYNKIEKQNSIKINVFGYEEKQPYPIHISKETFEDQMNLLLITKDEKKHHVLIKDFNRFTYIYCLQCFKSESILTKHVGNCLMINGKQAINMPKKGENMLKFTNLHKQQAVPFVIYSDFEVIMKKVQGCKPKDAKSYMEAYQTHDDRGYGYKIACCYKNKYSKPIQTYRGENAVYEFMERG